ncbi:MAG: hypothetical protein Q7T20_13870 [Saprospiraceae bacterium]|nr:hypothetical protein [Saprospiraceae bacterium]
MPLACRAFLGAPGTGANSAVEVRYTQFFDRVNHDKLGQSAGGG